MNEGRAGERLCASGASGQALGPLSGERGRVGKVAGYNCVYGSQDDG